MDIFKANAENDSLYTHVLFLLGSTNIPCFIQSFGPEDGPDCDFCWDGLVPLSFKLRLILG